MEGHQRRNNRALGVADGAAEPEGCGVLAGRLRHQLAADAILEIAQRNFTVPRPRLAIERR